MERLAFSKRRQLAVARTGSLFLDSVLIAYAAWCVQFIGVRLGWCEPFLARWPGLLLVAPFLAILWQTSGTSLGQRGYRNRIVLPDEAPANLDRRAGHGLLVALQLALCLLPIVLAPNPAAGLLVMVALLLTFALLGIVQAEGRSLSERLAGVRTTTKRVPAVGAIEGWYRRANAWIVLGLLLLTFVVGGILTELDLGALAEGAGRTGSLWGQLFDPDWSITGRVIERMVETIFLALMASALALPLAFGLSFLGARNLMQATGTGRVVYVLARVLMNVVRSIEPLVWAIIFVLWVGIGPFAGMLALLVHSTAALGKLYSEAIESIDTGPVEAIRATGAGPLQVIRYAVVPQVVPPFLSFTVYRWDINVRMATILGLVGGGGIGDLLINYQQLGAWQKVGTIIVFVTLVVWIMDLISARARERLA